MTSRWYHDMELARIGAETEIMHERDGIREIHPAGCRCTWCSEVRAAVGGSRRMDKHIARTVTARERGRIAAEQEITAQRKREAAGLAEVTRELADYGTYPYRTSERDDECTCGRYAVQVWAAHQIGCPRRAALIDAMRVNAARLAAEQLKAKTLIDGEPAPPADPVAQWWKVTRSLILPDFGQLAARVPDQPPGTCTGCRTGPLFAGNQCWYCNALDDLAIAKPQPNPPASNRGSQVAVLLILVLAAVVFWMTVFLIATGALR